MSGQVVLVTDPIGDDASVIADVLKARHIDVVTPSSHRSWKDYAVEADGLIVNLVTMDAYALQALKRCRVIARLGTGFNNVDVASAKSLGIVVTNVPDYCREEVSDHTIALILASIRKLLQANSTVQRLHWNQLAYRPIRRLSTLTLGLVGFGRLAQSVAAKAAALGMRVIAHDPYIEGTHMNEVHFVPFDSLLNQSDVVSLHVPQLAETRGMMGADQFQRMKQGSILVNTARGELVDERALAKSLDEEHLAGAALDVLSKEPVAADSPLLGRENVLLTPHIAFYSEESLADLQRTAAEEVAFVLSNQVPRHRVA